MNLKFLPSAVALVLSAHIDIVASSNGNADNVALTDLVASSYREESASANAAVSQRLTKRVKFTSDAIGGADGDSSGPDVGVLGLGRRRRRNGIFSDSNRRLQASLGSDVLAEDNTCPRPDTCEPNLCECVANGGKGIECAEELDAVCKGVMDANGNEWTIGGCVSNADYYRNAYCPFAECLVNGGSLESCDCIFYGTVCALYRDHVEYNIDMCEETADNCAVDACCKTKTDDEGKGMCLEGAPTGRPSMMPSTFTKAPVAPTTSPTPAPQGSTPAVPTAPTGASSPSDTRPTPPDRPAASIPATVSSPTVSGPSPPAPANAPPNGTPPTGETGTMPTPPTANNKEAPAPASVTEEGASIPLVTEEGASAPLVTDGEAPVSTAASTDATPSSARSLMPWGVVEFTTSLVAATMVWSLFG